MNLGIFQNDKFQLQELTSLINEAPMLPSRLASLKLFAEEGIQTTTMIVEKNVDNLLLVPNIARAAAPGATGGSTRSVVSFLTTHLPTQDTITADDVQNLRAFGKASDEETMLDFVGRRLAKMRRRLDATIEYQRVGAIKGTIVDSDGVTVINNLFTTFGLVQKTQALSLNLATADIRNELLDALYTVETELGFAPYSGMRCLCGRTFFQQLIAHASVKNAYQLWETGTFLRNDPRNGFDFAGITFEYYRGQAGGTPFIPDGEAYLFPEGVEDMFITRFAPANYVETANTIGLPYYSKQYVQPLDKGIILEAQTNPLSICTRPTAVLKLTVAP